MDTAERIDTTDQAIRSTDKTGPIESPKVMMPETETSAHPLCFHCGLECPDDSIRIDEKYFCCHGCKAVYELLSDSSLEGYYQRLDTPGVKPNTIEVDSRYAYLDDPDISRRLLDFSDERVSRLRLELPQIRCTACVFLLENLFRLTPGVAQSTVDFQRRELTVVFENDKLNVRSLVELLTRLGYEPTIRLASLDSKKERRSNNSLYIKVGVAGFAFGNIMLFSFPEYLATANLGEEMLSLLFRWGSIIIAIPVLLYSASDYFRSAYNGLRQRMLNIDLPIALGMSVLFGRSLYDIIAGIGPGYLDSFSGLTFFLLIGRIFQQKTYHRMSFERDYRSYFPISVIRKRDGEEKAVPVTHLQIGDDIIVRSQEIVPADAVLTGGQAHIDYSFVTGESDPRDLSAGTTVYAGGRQIGGAIELKVARDVSQSYLTSLWSNKVFDGSNAPGVTALADRVARYFTPAVLGVALIATLYWLNRDPASAFSVASAILIVACPCALALSSPFALGTALRIMGKRKLFLKDNGVVERLAQVDAIVFDKTGTLAHSSESETTYNGRELSDKHRRLIASLAAQSTHPVSRNLRATLEADTLSPVADFVEEPGKGIRGIVDGHLVVVGKQEWVNPDPASAIHSHAKSDTWVAIDSDLLGRFSFNALYREGLPETVKALSDEYGLSVISGDSDRDRNKLAEMFGDRSTVAFSQTPYDKLDYVRRLKDNGHTVLMAGDGLNDGGALKAADIGLAVTEDTSAFSPACDGIIDASQLRSLDRFLEFARRSVWVVWASFVLSFLYNIIGLGFAVTGHLSPVVSAILMPASSITVVVFATLMTRVQARRSGVR